MRIGVVACLAASMAVAALAVVGAAASQSASAWSSAEEQCPLSATWATLPRELPAIHLLRPSVTLGQPLTGILASRSHGTYGYSASYGSGARAFSVQGGSFCASGEWGDFDASSRPARTIRLRGHSARLLTKDEPGGIIDWTENGVHYRVASHDLPAARVVQIARSLRAIGPVKASRFCVIDVTPLNIRTAPGVQAPRVGAIPVGDCTVRDATRPPQVAAASTGRPWRRVVWHETSGWVSDLMLRKA